MSKIKLNVYESDMKTIAKTYSITDYRISFGMTEDIIRLFGETFFGTDNEIPGGSNIETLSGDEIFAKIASTVTGSLDAAVKLITEAIPEITDEELRCTRLDEIMEFIVELVKFSVNGFTAAFSKISKKKTAVTAK